MPRWEYHRIYLIDVPARMDEIDLLNAAGKDRWELVAITRNSVAYMKRQIPEVPHAEDAPLKMRRKAAAGRMTRES